MCRFCVNPARVVLVFFFCFFSKEMMKTVDLTFSGGCGAERDRKATVRKEHRMGFCAATEKMNSDGASPRSFVSFRSGSRTSD